MAAHSSAGICHSNAGTACGGARCLRRRSSAPRCPPPGPCLTASSAAPPCTSACSCASCRLSSAAAASLWRRTWGPTAHSHRQRRWVAVTAQARSGMRHAHHTTRPPAAPRRAANTTACAPHAPSRSWLPLPAATAVVPLPPHLTAAGTETRPPAGCDLWRCAGQRSRRAVGTRLVAQQRAKVRRCPGGGTALGHMPPTARFTASSQHTLTRPPCSRPCCRRFREPLGWRWP
jgi:hypothetical protein